MGPTSGQETFSQPPLMKPNLFGTYGHAQPLLSDEATAVIIWVICQAIDIFGVGTNIINIICFIKQGFKDSVNTSLLGLAVADFGSLTTLIWTNIFLTPAFSSADLPFDSTECMYLTSGLSHVTFSRISGWITALITLERCVCITAPLKVKSLITPKRATVVIIFVFVILISSVAPMYIVNRLDMKFFPQKNKTLLGIVSTDNRETVESWSYIINNVIFPFSAFFIIIVCTAVLIFKLRETTKWRNESTSSGQGGNISHRNQRVAKMVVMISTLFIVCFIPLCILYIAMSLLPELSVDGKHKNIVLAVAGFSVMLESINCSSNIFIYYQMSSKYRTAFCQLFSLKQGYNKKM